MSTARRVTAVVFASDKLRVVHDDPSNRHVVAVADVAKGDLLLVEELVGGRTLFLKHAVASDEVLFKILHPRREDDGVLDAGDLLQRAEEKINKNSWEEDGSIRFVGDVSSAFDHSCSPNAVFCVLPIHGNGGFAVVYAGRDICAGSEITVTYGTDVGHGHKAFPEIRCEDPDCTDESRLSSYDNMSNMGYEWLEADCHGIKSNMLQTYLRSQQGQGVYDAHHDCRRMLKKRKQRS